ncbi:hypothetical protein MKX01_005352 [Papaver californicum]|nr:hypothetical protein MKX01_005352 [Papaver californicum]
MAEVTEKREITEPMETESRAYGTATTGTGKSKCFLIGMILRGLLFALTLTSFFIQTVLADVVFGILASATGTAGGVAYVGLKGNSHIGWFKICNIYDKFCRHIAASLVLSLVALVILLILITLSTIQTRC